MEDIKTWRNLRKMFDEVFAPDTASSFSSGTKPSSGHCASVAIVVQAICGGQFRSCTISGQSHWYNRVNGIDVDLTGDQFGLPAVNVGKNIYPQSLERQPIDLNDETIDRGILLAKRMGFSIKRPR